MSPIACDPAPGGPQPLATARAGRRERLARWGLQLLVLVTGLAITGDAFYVVRINARTDLAVSFRHQATLHVGIISEAVLHQLANLQGLARFFESSDEVTPDEFRHYAVAMLKSGPVQAIEWIPRVPRSRRDSVIAAARARGLAGFRITETDANGALREAGSRDEYYPVCYVEPLAGNEAVIGYDLLSHPARRAALVRARDEGRTAVTEPVTLVQARHTGVLVFVPVYSGRNEMRDAAAREARIAGFVLGVYRVEKLIGNALRGVPEIGLNIAVEDLHGPAELRTLFVHDAGTSKEDDLPTHDQVIPVGDREWRVRVTPGVPFVAANSPRGHHAVLPFGLLLTLFATQLAGQLVRGRMAEERGREAVQQALLDNLPFLAWLKDREGRFLAVNEAFSRACGRPIDAIVGRTDRDVWPRDLAARHLADDAEAMAQRRQRHVEEPLTTCEGSGWFETCRTPIHDAAGTLLGTTGFARDISARKEAEERLKKSEEQVRLLLNSTAEGIYGIDLRGDCTFANRSCVNLLGFSDANQLLGKNMHWLIHHSTPDGSRMAVETCSIYQAFREGKGTHRDDEVLWRADGTCFPAEYWSYPQLVDGVPSGAVVTFVDITKRRQADQELRDAYGLLSGLLDSIPDVVFFKNREGRYLGCNPEFARFVGLPREQIVGKTDHDLFASDVADSFREQDRLMFESGQPRHNEEWVRYPDGTRVLLDTLKAPLRYKDGEVFGMLGVSRDITARRETEDTLRVARDAAEKANRAKSEFLANMSHEIRTPLNAVLGFAELLRGAVQGERERSFLDAIATSGKSLLTVINDILDMSKIEAGLLELRPEAVNLRLLVEEVAQVFRLRAAEKGLDVVVRVAEDLPSALLLDAMRLRQVLFNLIGNAVKFTHKGSITVSLAVSDTGPGVVDLRLSVCDTGIGIPEHERERIFAPFVQQEGLNVRQYGGTGLGLAISRRLTAMLNGALSVESNVGKGSCFAICLRSVPVVAPPARSEDAEARVASVHFDGAVMVHADDSESNRMLVREMLDGHGVVLLEADDGEAAVSLAQQEQPAAVILDIKMPRCDGRQAAYRLRASARTASVPLIALTASVTEHPPPGLFDAVLYKPLKKADLLGALTTLVPTGTRGQSVPEPAGETVTPARPERSSLAALVAAAPEGYWSAARQGNRPREIRRFAEWLIEQESTSALAGRMGRDLKAAAEQYQTERLRQLIEQLGDWIREKEAGGDSIG